MKPFNTILLISTLILVAPPARAHFDDHPVFRIERLSDRVLVLVEDSPMENIITVIASQKGLIVVDTTGSTVTAAAVRELARTDQLQVDDPRQACLPGPEDEDLILLGVQPALSG